MGKTIKRNKPPISQPFNPVHREHIGPVEHGKQSSDNGAKGNLYVDQPAPSTYETPIQSQNKLPPPCPGPSSVQNTGATGLDQRTLDTITRCVTETVRRELTKQLEPVRDTVQQLLTQTSKSFVSCQHIAGKQTGNQALSAEDKSTEYVNSEECEPPELRTEPRSGTTAARLSNIPNPIYSRQPEELQVVCRPKSGTKPPLPAPRPHVTPNRLRRDCPGRLDRKVSFNKRDCYAKALRTHIEEIVGTTLFTETELPDILISEGCLTEDECRTIREKVDRKDQIRILVAVIKTRDLKVLTRFLDFLERDNKHLVQKINESADNNIKNGFRERWCSICKLKGQVNVKYVADKLWAEGFIPDDLYNQLIFTEKPTGTQDKQWERILDSFAATGTLVHAFETLMRFLRDRGHYSYLADEMQKMALDTVKRPDCYCNINVRMTTYIASSSSSLEPKSTDLSSTEILDDEFSPRHSSEELLDEGIRRYAMIGDYSRDDKQEVSENGTNVNSARRPALIRGDSIDTPPPPLPVKKRSLPRDTKVARTTDEISTKRTDHDISTKRSDHDISTKRSDHDISTKRSDHDISTKRPDHDISTKRPVDDISTYETTTCPPAISFMDDSWTNRTTIDNVCTSRTWPKSTTHDTPMAIAINDVPMIRTTDDIPLIKVKNETQMVKANNDFLTTRTTRKTAMTRIRNDGLTTKATIDTSVTSATNETSQVGFINGTWTDNTTDDTLTTKESNNTPPIKYNDDSQTASATNDTSTYGNLMNRTGNDALATTTATLRTTNDHPPTRADNDAFTTRTTDPAPVTGASGDTQTNMTIYDIPIKRGVHVARASNDACTNRNINDTESISTTNNSSKPVKLFCTSTTRATHDTSASTSPYDILPKTRATNDISPTLVTNDTPTARSTNDTLEKKGIYDTLPTKVRDNTSTTITTKNDHESTTFV